MLKLFVLQIDELKFLFKTSPRVYKSISQPVRRVDCFLLRIVIQNLINLIWDSLAGRLFHKPILGNRLELKRNWQWSLGNVFRCKRWTISVVVLHCFEWSLSKDLCPRIPDCCRETIFKRLVSVTDVERVPTLINQRLFKWVTSKKTGFIQPIWLTIAEILMKSLEKKRKSIEFVSLSAKLNKKKGLMNYDKTYRAFHRN